MWKIIFFTCEICVSALLATNSFCAESSAEKRIIMQIEKEVIKIFLYSFVLLGLIIETVVDIREKKVWIPVVLIEIPVLLGFNCWIGNGSILLFIASFGIGAVFYLISVITKGQIGKGDALIFCMTGAGIGLVDNILIIYLTFFLAFLAAVFLWLVKKVGRKYTMPLVPFILCAYMIVVGGRIWE